MVNNKIVTSITKTDGAADVKLSTTGAGATTEHHLIASDSETVQAVWEGDTMKNYAVNGQRALTDLTKSTDGDDHYLVGAQYNDDSTNLKETPFTDVAATTVKGGKGNDSFTITKTQTNMITVEGGEGKDQVSINTASKMKVKISDGDSVKGSNDVVYGFKTANAATNDILDLDTTKIKSTMVNTAENIANGIQGWNVGAKGNITFYKENTFATKTLVNAKNLDSVLKFLAEKLNGTGDTVTFGYDRDGDGKIDSTYVFQDGNKDTVVELAGVGNTATDEAAGLNTVATNGDITIA